ncbi:tRNA lysidine(34) synthetase TilS [Rugosibacter aromaticivorans]|uniref:tRNA lysidine(34) synthetase TilS n=1 Tax=Rugosibacter aromaticivorans TaxID=1565605 RepID=UPI000A9768CB|nr:tRNA lysidine(34) synthetase TilS [Rugosibacter aromaticivorans]TBR13320.1 MAG: tRNA lysidine(34) synthetase TilS [Rugosibacter sp.]
MVDSRNKQFSKRVEATLTDILAQHALRGQSLTVAYSGGLDSTVLLYALKNIAPMLDLHLTAVHVHHGLSENADEWSDHCTLTCAQLGIELSVVRVLVKPELGEGIEAAARKVRLDAVLAHSSGWVCMAHHANDQAETVLHNLLRGSGLRGAGGVPVLRGRVFRPFLTLPKEFLLAYAIEHQLRWVEDESNKDRYFTRNYLRHEVVPLLKARFPRAVEQLSIAARRFADAQALLDDLALLDLKKDQFLFPIETSLLLNLTEVRARNLMRSLLSGNKVQLPDERRLNEFVRQVRTAANDRHPSLETSTYRLWVALGELHFKKKT